MAHAVQEFLVGSRRSDVTAWDTLDAAGEDAAQLPALVAMQVAGLVQRGVVKEEVAAGEAGFGRVMPLYVRTRCGSVGKVPGAWAAT